MSTKNLSRTIIEGGRANFTKVSRKRSIRAERRAKKKFCCNAEFDDEKMIKSYGGKKLRYKFQYDCLNPLRRFLEKNVGRSWNKVYADLKSKFDERTIKGYHLLNDHIRNSIDGAGGYQDYPIGILSIYRYFYIDDNYILRAYKYKPSKYKAKPIIDNQECKRILKFLGKRKIIRNGNVLCWVEPLDSLKAIDGFIVNVARLWFGAKKIIVWNYSVKKWVEDSDSKNGGYWSRDWFGEFKYRQGKKLSSLEMSEWNSFSEAAQQLILRSVSSNCLICDKKIGGYRGICYFCISEI